MPLTVIVPAYNAQKTLPKLLDSLSNQSYSDFEVIVVDDYSQDYTPQIVQSYPCSLIRLSENHGPAYCRNIGAKNAKGDILVFTDSDCRVDRYWLEIIQEIFNKYNTEAIMGRLVLMPSSVLGDSISALGFPAGGAVGFDKIWKVDKKGFTDSLSSCNCAIKKDIFWKVGGFDESFPYAGGEDSLLAYNLRGANYKIKYCPDVLVYHEARNSMRSFIKWQFKRGVSSYIFSTKVCNREKFISLRLWSIGNILKHNQKNKGFLFIFALLGMSIFLQCVGALYGKYKGKLLCGF
ncbi:MAG: glycosyltransferase [Deltaproteobacteria bacterium]|nr:glycosyltransferase [Deltaproteobacteria bacterium]